MPNIPITEIWDRHDWSNFDADRTTTDGVGLGLTGNVTYPFGLSTQKHIDVRTFTEGSWTGLITGYLSSFNNWPGATATLTAGSYTFTSQYTKPIDLTQMGTGTLALTVPNFPITHLNLGSCFLDLSSDNYVHTCSLAWNATSNTPINGNTSLQWNYSALTGIDLTKITNVRIRVSVSSNCTLVMMALRLLGTSWVQTSVDFDNLNGQVRQGIPLTGDTTLVPTDNLHAVPPLWRSANPAGVDDPRPINAELGFVFNTGSQTALNRSTVYMRQIEATPVTQSELQGVTQAGLNGLPQPSIEPMGSSWISFTVQWGPHPLIRITDSIHPNDGYQFTGITLANNTTYYAICNLTETNARIQILPIDPTTLIFQSGGFSLGLFPSLVLDPDLALYPSGAAGGFAPFPSPTLYPSSTLYPSTQLFIPIFDTTVIPDPFMFTRRPGRIGVQAVLSDGDAYVSELHPRSTMFAEYRSRPLKSITPVQGANLYVQSAPEIDMFTGWTTLADVAGNAPTLTNDQQRYLVSHPDKTSTRVQVTTASTATPSQGIITNSLTPVGDSVSGITDFNELDINLSLWVPSAAFAGSTLSGLPLISAALLSQHGNLIPINLPPPKPDQWSLVKMVRPVAPTYPVSGLYQLILYYNGVVPTTFWVDGVSVEQHAMDWSARSVVDDPWSSNLAPWTTFHDKLNSAHDGVRFTFVGDDLQIRGQALRQDAMVLSAPKIVPKYAELGRLVWPEDELPASALPTASISSSFASRTYTFDGRSSSSSNKIADYVWAFGDGGFATGPVVTYTYSSFIPASTQYEVTLTVLDRAGQANTTNTLVILS